MWMFIKFHTWHSMLKSSFENFIFFLSLHFSSSSPSFLSLFAVVPLSHELISTTILLQLSTEEGYVSAKEDSFLSTPHPCEEQGLAGKALFRADLALVSGYNLPSLIFKYLSISLPFKIFWRSLPIFFALFILETHCAHLALNPSMNYFFDSILIILIFWEVGGNNSFC